MGSTGSGRFSDYSSVKSTEKSGGGAGGGSSGRDRCQKAFSALLEEVAQCDHYARTKSIPAPGEQLRVILQGRLFAVNAAGVKIGALPTSFNYLAACLEAGFNYVGVVTSSSMSPVPTIEADFAAQ